MRTTFITGCDRGLGLSLATHFAQQGWRVFAGSYLPDWPQLAQIAGQYPDRIHILPLDIASDTSVEAAAKAIAVQTPTADLVINNAAISSPLNDRGIHDGLDYDDILRLFEVNTLGALRVTTALLPLLENSTLKRLCYVSSEAGSVTRCQRVAWYGYCMSKTALNQGVRHFYNKLHPEGYTFRLLHPGWMRTYMSGTRNEKAELEPDEVAVAAYEYFVGEQDEDHLVMRDWQGNEWPR